MSNWNNQCEPGNRNGFDEYAGGLDLKALAITSNVIGWVYFLAWSISFYPQVKITSFFHSPPQSTF